MHYLATGMSCPVFDPQSEYAVKKKLNLHTNTPTLRIRVFSEAGLVKAAEGV